METVLDKNSTSIDNKPAVIHIAKSIAEDGTLTGYCGAVGKTIVSAMFAVNCEDCKKAKWMDF